jgi:alkanesulfonate monooxygenase SsuD/methylene tetrahydromethanopterin reductase-like flavin-dependent oxidoreductase (luciferase family)
MKLDLLYEIDAPMPWDEAPHPYGQRLREQRAYRECIEQVKLADNYGFNTCWFVEHHFRAGRSHCPAPEVVIGALTQATKNIRLGFGVTLLPYGFTHPIRVAEKVAAADVLSGGRCRVGHRSFDADGTNRVPRRSRQVTRRVERSDQHHRRSVEERALQLGFADVPIPERVVTPKPFQDPHPPAWMAATSTDSCEIAGSLGLGLLSFSIMQPLEVMAEQVARYRKAQLTAKPITDVTTNKVAAYTLVHCAETKQQAIDNGIWKSVGWWYQNLAQFTLDWEFPNLSPEERDATFPLLNPLMEGNVPIDHFDKADMIVVGDPEECFTKMKHYADLGVDQLICLRAVRLSRQRVGAQDHRVAGQRGHPRTREVQAEEVAVHG